MVASQLFSSICDHPEGDRADGLIGEPDDALTGFAPQASGEAANGVSRSLALRVQDRRDDHGEQEVDDDGAEIAEFEQEPGQHGPKVGREPGRGDGAAGSVAAAAASGGPLS